MAGGNVGMRRRWGSASPPRPLGASLPDWLGPRNFPNGATGQSRYMIKCRLEVEAGGGAVGD